MLRRLSGALAVGGGVARGGRMVMLAFSTQAAVILCFRLKLIWYATWHSAIGCVNVPRLGHFKFDIILLLNLK